SPATATLGQGKTTSTSVSVGSNSGYAGTVSLSVSGLPTDATATFSSSSVSAPGSSQLTVTAASTTPIGTYALTINGTSGTIVHTATFTVTVVIPDFAVSSSTPSAAILPGQTASYPVSVGALNGFTGSIALTVTGYPASSTVLYSPSSVA